MCVTVPPSQEAWAVQAEFEDKACDLEQENHKLTQQVCLCLCACDVVVIFLRIAWLMRVDPSTRLQKGVWSSVGCRRSWRRPDSC